MTRHALAAVAAVALLGGSAPGLAQQTRPGQASNAKHDNNAPVDFSGDRIEVQDRDHKATLIGNVRIVQQEMTLTADRVVVVYTGSLGNAGDSQPGQAKPAAGAPGGSPKAQRMDASGHVVVVRPGEIAKGDYGIDDLQTKLITLIGNVSLDRNGSIVHGGRLVIDQNTNRATVDGAPVGGAGAAGKGGRVSGRFLVDNGNSDAADNGQAAKPAPQAPPKK